MNAPSLKLGHILSSAEQKLQGGQAEEALNKYFEVFSVLHEGEYIPLICDLYYGLSEAYLASGEFLNAYVYAQRFHKLKDFLENERKAIALADLDDRYKTAENNRVLAVVERENAIQSEMLTQSRWIISMMVMMLAFLFMLFSNLRRKKRLIQLRAKQAALEQEAEISKLEKERDLKAMQALFSGQEQERRRIARDLHDSLGGLLYALQLQLNSKEQSSDAKNLLRRALTENRRISDNLLPPTLDRLGLIPAIEEWAELFESNWGLDFDVHTPNAYPIFTKEATISLFRIAQELTTNVARHAQATHVLLSLDLTDDALVLSVTDDGSGIPVGTDPMAVLKTVRSRAQLLKGQVKIDSKSGIGTTVAVEIPLADICLPESQEVLETA